MRIHLPGLMKVGAFACSQAVRGWMRTLDYRAAFYDETVDPVRRDFQGPKIFIFWHEYILFPLYLRGHCDLAMLLSRHRDAEVLSHVAHHMGFSCIRGSTARGGATAVREMFRACENLNLAITPDGPRGPRRTLAQGPIYLASKLGLPIVAMGLAYDRPWRLNSWDRFAIPRLGSRARAIVSPQLEIPPDLDRAGVEYYRQRVEGTLNCLSEEAEAWAMSGTRREGEVAILKQTAPLRHQRWYKPHSAGEGLNLFAGDLDEDDRDAA